MIYRRYLNKVPGSDNLLVLCTALFMQGMDQHTIENQDCFFEWLDKSWVIVSEQDSTT